MSMLSMYMYAYVYVCIYICVHRCVKERFQAEAVDPCFPKGYKRGEGE